MTSLRFVVLSSLMAAAVGCSGTDGSSETFIGSPEGAGGGVSPEPVEGATGGDTATGGGPDLGLGGASTGGETGVTGGSGGGSGGSGGGTTLDPCEGSDCGNGQCVTVGDEGSCSCDAGWTGEACDEPVVGGCDSDPCEHGACSDEVGGDYSCLCDAGFSGANCDQNIDDCAALPCDNGGTCVDGVASYSCECPAGFDGPTCASNIDDCAAAPCDNGVCSDDIDSFVCECPAGWSGPTCADVVASCADSPCDQGTCTDTGTGTYSCACDSGYSGANCDQCDTDYTRESGVCIDQKMVQCDASGTPLNGAATAADVLVTYTSAGGWSVATSCEFSCNAGWMGSDCATSVDDCAAGPCENGGTCLDGHQSYLCMCSDGFEGDDCETNRDDCLGDPCENGGTCSDSIADYSCECPAPYAGKDCDVCASDYTDEGGGCINQKTVSCDASSVPGNGIATPASVSITFTSAGGWSAAEACAFSCQSGWTGSDCSLSEDDCVSHLCQNGAACQDGHQAYTCDCAPGFSGSYCENNTDDCSAAPCDNGGSCTDEIDGFSCDCPTGYGGATCAQCDADYINEGAGCINEKLVACDSSTTPANGSSTPSDVRIVYTTAGGWAAPAACEFSCNAGWSGSDCSASIDDCAGAPCDNGGDCIDGHQSFTCDCAPGYSGATCGVNDDDCNPDPCDHGACSDAVADYVCACESGYAGKDCDTCDSDYAFYGGACINSRQVSCNDVTPPNGITTPGNVSISYSDAGGWTTPSDCAFSCQSGWGGSDCSVDVDDSCQPDPCDEGSCSDGVGDYTCSCNTGYAGKDCDTCDSDYAFYGGACINSRQVSCNDVTPPNGITTPGNVSISYSDAGGWTTPSDCAFSCQSGWGGSDCSVDVEDNCAGNSCDHGSCVDGVGSYTCSCDAGWGGALCETPDCDCGAGESCDAGSGACYVPGLIDSFESCDTSIEEVEGREGYWWFAQGSDVGCMEPECGAVLDPGWGSGCGAWMVGGSSGGSEAWAEMGFSLADGADYDACAYNQLEVTYESGQGAYLNVKWWNGSLQEATVPLPVTSGPETAQVSLSGANLPGYDCSALREISLEPGDISGFGMSVYELQFSVEVCVDDETRCADSSTLETCASGSWEATACSGGTECSAGACVDSSATPVARNGHLSVSGTQMVNEDGNPVQLKGVSTHWLNWADDDDYEINQTALIWMRDNWDLSVIRAAMGVEVDGGYFQDSAAMLADVGAIVTNAQAAGVYVIIDWHTHHGEDQSSQAQAFFKDMAETYGDLPNVIFEVYNEPLNVSWTNTLKPYHASVLSMIRNNDADSNDNIVILGTPNWDQDVDEVVGDEVAGSNLMYAVHFYSCSHLGTGGTTTELDNAKYALANGVPIFVSEWGATHADGGKDNRPYGGADNRGVCSTSADGWHDWMDSNNIGWAAWKLDDCDYEISESGNADSSCILAQGASSSGGWGASDLQGHGSYIAGKMQN